MKINYFLSISLFSILFLSASEPEIWTLAKCEQQEYTNHNGPFYKAVIHHEKNSENNYIPHVYIEKDNNLIKFSLSKEDYESLKEIRNSISSEPQALYYLRNYHLKKNELMQNILISHIKDHAEPSELEALPEYEVDDMWDSLDVYGDKGFRAVIYDPTNIEKIRKVAQTFTPLILELTKEGQKHTGKVKSFGSCWLGIRTPQTITINLDTDYETYPAYVARKRNRRILCFLILSAIAGYFGFKISKS